MTMENAVLLPLRSKSDSQRSGMALGDISLYIQGVKACQSASDPKAPKSQC